MDTSVSGGAFSNVPIFFSYSEPGCSYSIASISHISKPMEQKLKLPVSIPLGSINVPDRNLPDREVKLVSSDIRAESQYLSLLTKLGIDEVQLELKPFMQLMQLASDNMLSKAEIKNLKKICKQLKNKAAQSSVRENQKISQAQLEYEVEGLKETRKLLNEKAINLEAKIKLWRERCEALESAASSGGLEVSNLQPPAPPTS